MQVSNLIATRKSSGGTSSQTGLQNTQGALSGYLPQTSTTQKITIVAATLFLGCALLAWTTKRAFSAVATAPVAPRVDCVEAARMQECHAKLQGVLAFLEKKDADSDVKAIIKTALDTFIQQIIQDPSYSEKIKNLGICNGSIYIEYVKACQDYRRAGKGNAFAWFAYRDRCNEDLLDCIWEEVQRLIPVPPSAAGPACSSA